MFQRLLISTDFSDGLHRLAKFVPSLAATGIKQVVFLHSVPIWEEGEVPRIDSKKVEQANQRLEVAFQNLPADIEVKVEVPSGRPINMILNTVEKYQSDLVMLGMPSRSLLDEKLFGSTTCGLAQRTPVPLMIIRPQLVFAFTNEEMALRCQHLFRCLLIPYDGSDSANYLVQCINQKAQSQPSQSLAACVLCWVIEQGGRRELHATNLLQQTQAQEALKAIKTDLEKLDLQVDFQVRTGNPVLEIQEAAQEFDISAIALSSPNFGKFWELSIPSFTGEILRRSWHPVLFFPPNGR
jgi:nucleotide-binding universal stress UspA family protein